MRRPKRKPETLEEGGVRQNEFGGSARPGSGALLPPPCLRQDENTPSHRSDTLRQLPMKSAGAPSTAVDNTELGRRPKRCPPVNRRAPGQRTPTSTKRRFVHGGCPQALQAERSLLIAETGDPVSSALENHENQRKTIFRAFSGLAAAAAAERGKRRSPEAHPAQGGRRGKTEKQCF